MLGIGVLKEVGLVRCSQIDDRYFNEFNSLRNCESGDLSLTEVSKTYFFRQEGGIWRNNFRKAAFRTKLTFPLHSAKG